MYHVTSADQGLHHHFINTRWGLRRHAIGLLRRRGRTGVFTSPIDYAVSPLHQAELLARTPRAWGLGPRPCRGLRTLSDLSQINGRLRPATSLNRVINTEHINQLSRFHAQKLSVLKFVRFDQALYFFGKKLFVKNFLVKTLFVTHKFKYPVYLGVPL